MTFDPSNGSGRCSLRAIPIEDRAWLLAALGDALQGGCPICPVAPDTPEDAVQALQREILPEGTALVIRTSGSSGVPKAVALSAAALRASADATHEALGGPGQWFVALPANLISGLQMLVRSAATGIDPVFFDGPFEASAVFARIEDMRDDRRYMSLVPVQLARLLDAAAQDRDAADQLRSLDAVLVGGQAVSLDLRRRAHDLGVRLVRSYGMTETSGGCVYDGVEIGDTRVRLRDGEIQLAGSTLALGYVGDPELTADRFITETGASGAPTRWYRTGDAGELLGGMLTVTGRIDRVIISGGVNVSLDEVERIVHGFPGWSSAVALAVPHPEWGERVGLVREVDTGEHAQQDTDAEGAASGTSVATRDGSASFDAVRDELRACLGVAATPEWVTETDELPRLPGGKPDLQTIGEWIGRLRSSFREIGRASRSADSDPQAHPRSETEEKR